MHSANRGPLFVLHGCQEEEPSSPYTVLVDRFHNRDGVCLLRGTNSTFASKWSNNGKLVPVHAMRAYRGSGSTAAVFLTSPRDGGKQSASRPVRLIRVERALDTY